MKILRAYTKSEQAYLDATLLESEGIEAFVIDDSAFGGNVLGAIKNSIRIEVGDKDWDRAREILGIEEADD